MERVSRAARGLAVRAPRPLRHVLSWLTGQGHYDLVGQMEYKRSDDQDLQPASPGQAGLSERSGFSSRV
jgi:hypothetical protein